MMNNIKIPYLIYPVILGLMAGWLASAAAGSVFARPRPLPAVKARQAAKPVSTPQLTETVIADNIFALELSPVPAGAAAGPGGTVYNPDGTPVSGGQPGVPPPPPFTAKLLGVLKDSAGENSIAIVSTDNGTVSIRLGGEKNGLKVASLDDFSAVVEKERRKYTLTLEKGESVLPAPGAKPAEKDAPKAEAQQTGTNINIGLKRDEVRTELKDLNKILQSALVSPFYQEGEFQGYRVTRMREDSPLRKLGLQPGDTITRINGNELKSPELLFNMLSQIDDISAISIDMIRNTEKKTIFVEIQ